MSPLSRPPLTSRIRASFDGKRTKSDASSPTSNGFHSQDADQMRSALDQVLNSDHFQRSIADHMARLIRPSIKTALDTIQPIVEAVYAHDGLLKRTNESVENILHRLDTVAEEPASTRSSWVDPMRANPYHLGGPGNLAGPDRSTAAMRSVLAPELDQLHLHIRELSRRIDIGNGRMSETADKVNALHAQLAPTAQSLQYVQAQQERLKGSVEQLMDIVPSDLSKCVKSIRTQVVGQDPPIIASIGAKLDEVLTTLQTQKETSSESPQSLPDLSSKLGVLREKLEAGITMNNEHFDDVIWRLSQMSSAIDGQAQVIRDMKDHDATIEIVKATHRANESHAAHARALEELKNHQQPAAYAPRQGFDKLETKIDDVLTTLEAHRLGHQGHEILAALQKSNDCHTANSDALDRVNHVKLQGSESLAKLDMLRDAIDSLAAKVSSQHTATRAPGSEGDAANRLIQNQEALRARLDAILQSVDSLQLNRSTDHTGHYTTTNRSLEAIANTLALHTTHLDGLSRPTSTPAVDSQTSKSLENISSVVAQNTIILEKIQSSDMSDEILTLLHDLKEIQSHHDAKLVEIKEQEVGAEILTLLHDNKDSVASHGTSFAEIGAALQKNEQLHVEQRDILLEHSNLLKGAKTASPESQDAMENLLEATKQWDASLSEMSDLVAKSHNSHTSQDVQLKEMQSLLATHATTLGDLLRLASASNEAHATHATSLVALQETSRAANEFHTSHVTALNGLRDMSSSVETPIETSTALETKADAIIAALDAQSGILSSVKDLTSDPSVLSAVKQLQEQLASHGAILEAMRYFSPHAEMTRSLNDLKSIVEQTRTEHRDMITGLHEDTRATHEELRNMFAETGSKESEATESNASPDDSQLLFDKIASVQGAIDRNADSILRLANQFDANTTKLTSTMSTLADEVKAEIDASSTEITSGVNELMEQVRGLADASSHQGHRGNAVYAMSAMGSSAAVDPPRITITPDESVVESTPHDTEHLDEPTTEHASDQDDVVDAAIDSRDTAEPAVAHQAKAEEAESLPTVNDDTDLPPSSYEPIVSLSKHQHDTVVANNVDETSPSSEAENVTMKKTPSQTISAPLKDDTELEISQSVDALPASAVLHESAELASDQTVDSGDSVDAHDEKATSTDPFNVPDSTHASGDVEAADTIDRSASPMLAEKSSHKDVDTTLNDESLEKEDFADAVKVSTDDAGRVDVQTEQMETDDSTQLETQQPKALDPVPTPESRSLDASKTLPDEEALKNDAIMDDFIAEARTDTSLESGNAKSEEELQVDTKESADSDPLVAASTTDEKNEKSVDVVETESSKHDEAAVPIKDDDESEAANDKSDEVGEAPAEAEAKPIVAIPSDEAEKDEEHSPSVAAIPDLESTGPISGHDDEPDTIDKEDTTNQTDKDDVPASSTLDQIASGTTDTSTTTAAMAEDKGVDSPRLDASKISEDDATPNLDLPQTPTSAAHKTDEDPPPVVQKSDPKLEESDLVADDATVEDAPVEDKAEEPATPTSNGKKGKKGKKEKAEKKEKKGKKGKKEAFVFQPDEQDGEDGADV